MKKLLGEISNDFSVAVLARLQKTTWSHLAFVRDPITGAIKTIPNR